MSLGTRPGVQTRYIMGTLRGHGQSTGPNPSQFILVTLEIPPTCVPAVYQLRTPPVFPWFTACVLFQEHSKCPYCVPVQETAVKFFGTPQVIPLRFSVPVSPAGKQAAHSKCSHHFPCRVPSHPISNTPWYNLKFPHSFRSMFRTGTLAVFPGCDRSVTCPPITVSRFGTPRCHHSVPDT